MEGDMRDKRDVGLPGIVRRMNVREMGVFRRTNSIKRGTLQSFVTIQMLLNSLNSLKAFK